MECSTRVQIALLSFGFGLVETHVHFRGLYLEDFEPVQILISSPCRVASNLCELSLTLFCS